MSFYPESFWDQENDHKKTFVTRVDNVGPKNQAKEYVEGGDLPAYFIYGEQRPQGYSYTIDTLPSFFVDI